MRGAPVALPAAAVRLLPTLLLLQALLLLLAPACALPPAADFHHTFSKDERFVHRVVSRRLVKPVDPVPALLARTGRSLSYSHQYYDPLGGLNHLSVASTHFPNVFILDELPHLTDVACRDNAALTLSVSDVRVAEPWLEGSQPGWRGDRAILSGQSSAYLCLSDGLARPFHRRILALANASLYTLQRDGSVREEHLAQAPPGSLALPWASYDPENTPTGLPVAATLTFRTEDTHIMDVFERLDKVYFRTPGDNEAEVRRQLLANASALRALHAARSSGVAHIERALTSERRLWWNPITAISSAASAVVSTVKAVGSVATMAYNAATGQPWGIDESYGFSWIEWNWDARAQQPKTREIPLLGEVVVCKACYAYIGVNFKWVTQFEYLTLKAFEVSVNAGAEASASLAINLPAISLGSRSSEILLYPPTAGGGLCTDTTGFPTGCDYLPLDLSFLSAMYGSNTATIFLSTPVPIWIEVGWQLKWATTLSAKVQGQIVGPGFTIGAKYSIGYKYDPVSKTFAPFAGPSTVFKVSPPSFDVKGSLTYKFGPVLAISFNIYWAFRLDFQIKPYVSSTLTLDVQVLPPPSCPGAYLQIDTSYGLDAAFVIQQPNVIVSVFGLLSTKLIGKGGYVEIPGLPKSFTLAIIKETKVASSGAQIGCNPKNNMAQSLGVPAPKTLPLPVTNAVGAAVPAASRAPTPTRAAPSGPSALSSAITAFNPLAAATSATSVAANVAKLATSCATVACLSSAAASLLKSSSLPDLSKMVPSVASGLVKPSTRKPADDDDADDDDLPGVSALSRLSLWRRQMAEAQHSDAAQARRAATAAAAAALAADPVAVCGAGGCSYENSLPSPCSVTCGAGSKRVTSVCRRTGGTGSIVPLAYCAAAGAVAPEALQLCEEPCPGYVPGALPKGFFGDAPASSKLPYNGTLLPAFGPYVTSIGAKVTYDPRGYDLLCAQDDDCTTWVPTPVNVSRVFKLANGTDSLHLWLQSYEGDSDIYVTAPMMRGYKSSTNWNYANDSIFLTSADGVRPDDTVLAMLYVWPPNLRYNSLLDNHGYALYQLTLTPYNELVDGVVAQGAASGALLIGPGQNVVCAPGAAPTDCRSQRYFRFVPSADAATFLVEATEASGHRIEVVANRWARNGWPSHLASDYTSIGSPGAPSVRHFSPDVSDFSADIYAIAVVCYAPAGATCAVSVRASNVAFIASGDVVSGSLLGGAVRHFVLHASPSDTEALVYLQSTQQSTNVYVSRAPFQASPIAECSANPLLGCAVDCAALPGVAWCSLMDSKQFTVPPLLITAADPQWGSVFYIAVSSPFSGPFKLSAQTYEAIDSGPALLRSQNPGSMLYYLGSPKPQGSASAVAAAQAGLSFHAHVALSSDSPGSVDLHAGASAMYFPAVQLGFEGVSAGPLVPGGPAGRIDAPYLTGTAVDQQMVLGVHSPIMWAPAQQQKRQLGGSASASGVRPGALLPPYDLPDIASSWAAALATPALGARNGSELRSAAQELVAERARGGWPSGPGHMNDWAPSRTPKALARLAALEGRRDLAPGPSITEAAAAAAFSAAAPGARALAPAGAPLLAHGAAKDEGHGEAAAEAEREAALASAASARAPPSLAASAARHLEAEAARATSAAEAAVARFAIVAEQNAHARARMLGGTITALTDAAAVYAASMPAPVSVPVFMYSPASAAWEALANCSAGSLVTASAPCAQLSGAATETLFLRMRLPARTGVSLSVAAAARAPGEPRDAPYALAVSMNSQVGALGSEPPSSAASWFVPNCLYTPQYAYLAIGGANPTPSPTRMSLFMAGTSNDAFLCPAYSWFAGQLSPCSATCGDGVQTRVVACVGEGNYVADDSLCPAATRPAASVPCSAGACAWATTPWQGCSQPCGGGLQARLVTCRNGNGGAYEVEAANCVPPAPAESQVCGTEPCPSVFFYAAPWSGCSAACGGGTQTRAVQCVRVAAAWVEPPAVLADFACLAPGVAKPPSQQPCNTFTCPLNTYTLALYDRRALESGVSVTSSLPAGGGAALYQFSKPNAGTRGVCVRVDTVPLPAGAPVPCTADSARLAAGCFQALQQCYSNATAAVASAAAAASLAPQFFAELGAINRAALPQGGIPAPPGGCACFAAAQACLAAVPACPVQPGTAAPPAALTTLCKATSCGASGSVCAALPPSPAVAAAAAAAAAGAVSIYATPLEDIGRPALQPFHPTASAAYARWSSVSPSPLRSQRLTIYGEASGYTARSASTIEIGVVTGNASAQVSVSATALTSFPVAASGTLLSGATAAAIQAGGLTLILDLTCDLFMLPQASATARGATYPHQGINLLAAGLIATTTSEFGWNRVARPYLLAAATPPFVAYSVGNTRATLTLPPIPGYSPSSSETLVVAVPQMSLVGNSETVLPGVTLTIAAASADCEAGPWGAWSPCSAACAVGQQTRNRAVTRQPAGSGAACPATQETRACSDCNQCSAVRCAVGALCAGGACLCPPGYGGADCSIVPAAAATPLWRASPWAPCSAACGQLASQSRTLTCYLLRGGSYAPAPDAPLPPPAPPSACADLPRPATTRQCNSQACSEPALKLVLALPQRYGAVIASAAIQDAYAAVLQAELSDALGVAAARVSVQGVFPATRAAAASPAAAQAPLAVGAAALSDASAAALPGLATGALALGASAPSPSPAPALTLIAVTVDVLPASSLLANTSASASSGSATVQAGAPIDAALATLLAGAPAPGSGLNTRGTLLPSVQWGLSSFTVVQGPVAAQAPGPGSAGVIATAAALSAGGGGGGGSSNSSGGVGAAAAAAALAPAASSLQTDLLISLLALVAGAVLLGAGCCLYTRRASAQRRSQLKAMATSSTSVPEAAHAAPAHSHAPLPQQQQSQRAFAATAAAAEAAEVAALPGQAQHSVSLNPLALAQQGSAHFSLQPGSESLDLPQGWLRCHDLATGDVWFEHHASDVSQWVHPAHPLPAGWEERCRRGAGGAAEVFYHNASAALSTAVRPQ